MDIHDDGVSERIDVVMSVYCLSSDGHHSAMESLLGPNQYAELSVMNIDQVTED